MSARDHLRALFIVFHVGAVLLGSIPMPKGLRREEMDSASMAPSLAPWEALAQRLGLADDQRGARDLLFRLAEGGIATRKAIIDPFQPYYRLSRARQGWTMFGFVNHRPCRLEIEVDRGAGWEKLYVARSSEHDWEQALFDQERMRALVNPWSHGQNRKQFATFAAWVARRVGAQQADVQRVAVSMVRLRNPPPAELRRLGRVPVDSVLWRDELSPQGDPL
jgi:hypothetical protein